MNDQLNLLERAKQGLREGRITQHEYDIYVWSLERKSLKQPDTKPEKLSNTAINNISGKESPDKKITQQISPDADQTTYQNKHARKSSYKKLIVAILLLVFLIDVVWMMTNTSSVSGNAIIDLKPGDYNGSFTLHSDDKLSSIRVTGVLRGEGSAIISYNTSNGLLHVATIRSDDGSPRTDKPSYAPDEAIMIQNEPSSYTAYLDDGDNSIAVILPLQAPQNNATLLIVANNSGELATYRLPITIGDSQRNTQFIDLCEQTCDMVPGTGDLIVETTGDAIIEFEKIAATTEENTAPTYTIDIGTVTIDGIESKQIDLNMHFTDPDQDTLYYSTSNSAIANLTVDENTLTITPITDGSETVTIYASDLKEITVGTFELTTNNVPKIIITPENDSIDNASRTIQNETGNTSENNESTNETPATQTTNTTVTNTSNQTTNTLDCSNPDPNNRPVACLYQNTEEYFPDQEILIENKDRVVVGRFTSIGNLLIKGDIIEHTTSTPGDRDWRVAARDRDGNEQPVVWIDTSTGTLHMKGELVEENTNLNPPSGSYSLMNKRSVFLAWADTSTGTLHVRGNVIPYRRSLE